MIRVENWCGHDIRFIEKDGEWLAILKDICDALNLKTFKVSQRLDPEMMIRVPIEIDARKFRRWSATVMQKLRKVRRMIMNRAERRRAEKNTAKKTATYNLTVDQINDIRNKAKDEAIEAAFTLALAIPVLVMKDKYSKLIRKEIDGKSREERFADFCLDWFDNVQCGLVSIEGIADQLYEETGIRICRKE